MSTLSTSTSGQGKPLVLLHGWGFSSQIWLPLLPSLTPDYQVTLIDLPGHGQSPLLPQMNTVEAVVDQLVKRTPQQATWLGWSLGGLLAQAVAKQHPNHLRQLLLVASTPKFVASDDWEHGMAPDLLARFSQQLQANTMTTLTRFIALQTMGSPHARQATRQLNEQIHQHLPSQAGLQWGLNLLKHLDLRESLLAPSCPVSCVFGAKDTLVSLALAEHLPQNYPKITTHVLEQAAHMPFFSHPELFLQWFRDAVFK